MRNLQLLIEQHSSRTHVSIDDINKSLPAIDSKTASNVNVIICWRQSYTQDNIAEERSREASEAIERASKGNQIFPNIAEARLFQSHRAEKLKIALPTV